MEAAFTAWLALSLYVLAALSDFLDGYFARKLNQTSDFGKFLDPITDKIFICSLLLTFIAIDRLHGIWVIPVLLIFVREFAVAGMREYLGSVKLEVTSLAKWKTTVQMVACGFLIIGPYIDFGMALGYLSLLISALLTLWTGWQYLVKGYACMNTNTRF